MATFGWVFDGLRFKDQKVVIKIILVILVTLFWYFNLSNPKAHPRIAILTTQHWICACHGTITTTKASTNQRAHPSEQTRNSGLKPNFLSRSLYITTQAGHNLGRISHTRTRPRIQTHDRLLTDIDRAASIKGWRLHKLGFFSASPSSRRRVPLRENGESLSLSLIDSYIWVYIYIYIYGSVLIWGCSEIHLLDV